MICNNIKETQKFINGNFFSKNIQKALIQDYDEVYSDILKISKNSKHMNYTLQSFIDYSQVNTDDFILNVKELNVQDLINRVID